MPVHDDANPTALRRRIFLRSLGANPALLRQAAGLHPVRASLVLSGAEKLTPDEARKFARAVAVHAQSLFA